MNVVAVADWMKSTWVNDLLVYFGAWSWPFLETLHFFGMCLLFGALLIMDLRLLGWEKAAAVAETSKLSKVAMIGFGINLVTGVLFCFGDPHRYFINIAFQMKLVLLLLAGLNFLYFKYKVQPLVDNIGSGGDTMSLAKFSGAASLILWLGVLSMGRLIPYLGTG